MEGNFCDWRPPAVLFFKFCTHYWHASPRSSSSSSFSSQLNPFGAPTLGYCNIRRTRSLPSAAYAQPFFFCQFLPLHTFLFSLLPSSTSLHPLCCSPAYLTRAYPTISHSFFSFFSCQRLPGQTVLFLKDDSIRLRCQSVWSANWSALSPRQKGMALMTLLATLWSLNKSAPLLFPSFFSYCCITWNIYNVGWQYFAHFLTLCKHYYFVWNLANSFFLGTWSFC